MFQDEKPASPYADMFGGDPQVKHDAAMNDLKDVFQQALNNSPAPVSTPKSALVESLERDMAELDALGKDKKAKEDQKAGVIEQIRNLVSVHDVTAEEIYGRGGRVKGEGKAKSGGKVPPKYRDPVSGATWTGRGRSPVWIADKDRSKFLIA